MTQGNVPSVAVAEEEPMVKSAKLPRGIKIWLRQSIRDFWYKRIAREITEEMGLHKQWYKEADRISPWKLPWFFFKLAFLYKHDYGTICHAVAAAAVASAWVMNKTPGGGITGFQSGAILWMFIRGWMTHWEGPLSLIQWERMLYPQYEPQFQKTMPISTWEQLQELARKKLEEFKSQGGFPHPSVLAHMQSIVAGYVPFGYVLEPDDKTYSFRLTGVWE